MQQDSDFEAYQEQNRPDQNQPSSQQQSQKQQFRGELDYFSMLCAICQEFLVHSTSTACEHNFCQRCLQEYMLSLDECPKCQAKVRRHKIASNVLLDNLILDFIKKNRPWQLQSYQQNLEQYKAYKSKRTITGLTVGTQVDVRDQDFVWCTGKVMRLANQEQKKKAKRFIIRYDRTKKKEMIQVASPRLAPLGFFTKREDIPKYQRGKLVHRIPEGDDLKIVFGNPPTKKSKKEKRQQN